MARERRQLEQLRPAGHPAGRRDKAPPEGGTDESAAGNRPYHGDHCVPRKLRNQMGYQLHTMEFLSNAQELHVI
jgi:hypothetical protein